MPTKTTKKKARQDAREGKKPTTQAGEYVREEMHEMKKGSGNVRSRKQAIAIGLSEARRSGVKLGKPAKGKSSAATRRKATRDSAVGSGHAPNLPRVARAAPKKPPAPAQKNTHGRAADPFVSPSRAQQPAPSARSRTNPPPSARGSRPSRRLPGRFGAVVWATLKAYFNDKVPRLGAALAFYTTVAVAPLLMLAVAVAQVFFKEENARARIIGEIRQLIGSDASQAIASVQPPAHGQHTAVLATWIGLVTLIIGGLGVFTHLQDALNTIWRAPAHTNETWPAMIKRRLFSFGTVIATGFVMLVSLTLSAALTWVGENASHWVEWPTGVFETLNFLLSFAVITCLFAIIFKLLPDVRVRWRDVWTGATVTALLFVAGKTALGIYLARSNVTSAYGAAGSIVALLLWCYYAAQILFIGAEYTRVHARTEGGRKRFEPET